MTSKTDYLELVEKILKWDHSYFVLDAPLVSDYDYDMAMRELQSIEAANPEWQTDYSPSRRVSGEVLDQFVKGEHPYALMSLSNVYSANEFRDYVERVKKMIQIDEFSFYCETKFDGLSMAVYYKSGEFSHALTRGDGRSGENVSSNLRTIRSIPLRLSKPIDLCLRAEVVMPRDEFVKLNRRQDEEGAKVFANPRNAAAGTIRQLDSRVAAIRNLDAYFYDVLDRDNHSLKSHTNAIQMLRDLGFKTDPLSCHCNNMDEVLEFYDRLGKKRHELNYDLDGIVVKIDDYRLYGQLGVTGKSPRWAIAFKYEAEQVETIVKNISVQVGRTGVLTPVAEFEPVHVAGSTVRFASLHNWDEIRSKDIRIGDRVKIEKAGDIIPQVVTVLIDQREHDRPEFPLPDQCPVCFGQVFKESTEVAYRCLNEYCDARLLGKLKHFVSRDALNIQGIGHSVLEQLLQLNMVQNPVDLFGLQRDDFLRLKETREKLAGKLYDAIQQKQIIELGRFVFALGIPHVGLQSAQLLSESFCTLERLAGVSVAELENLDGIGPVMAVSIVNFFQSEYFNQVTESLKKYGLQIVQSEASDSNRNQVGILATESICFTGKLERMSRSRAQEIARQHGAVIHNTISKTTTILVYGDKAGSKLKKAEALGIHLLTEDEFFERLESSV